MADDNFQLITVAQLIAANNWLSHDTEDFIDAASIITSQVIDPAVAERKAAQARIDAALKVIDQHAEANGHRAIWRTYYTGFMEDVRAALLALGTPPTPTARRTDMRFHIGDLLSVTTQCLYSPDGIDGVYRILNHMTGDNLMTHQLPAAADQMAPILIRQFPWLDGLKPPDSASDDASAAWMQQASTEHGEWHDVVASPSSVWGEHDALRDLVDMVGSDRVIPVVLPEERQP